MANSTLSAYTGSGTVMTLSISTWDTDVLIRDISLSGSTRGFIETTHMNTTPVTDGFGSKTYLPHRHSDAGTLSIDFLHNPDFVPPIQLITSGNPVLLITDLEKITITFLDGENMSGAKWVCDGFVIDFDVNIPHDGPEMAGSCTWKLSGNIVVTADV